MMLKTEPPRLSPVACKSLKNNDVGGCVPGFSPAVPGCPKSLKNNDVGGVLSPVIYKYILAAAYWASDGLFQNRLSASARRCQRLFIGTAAKALADG
jgi:hypothetical protein